MMNLKNTYMKFFYLFIFVVMSLSISAKEKNTLTYEISCAGNAVGYYIVEVSAYVAKKKDINEDFVKKCALHGVLFKGFSGELGCGSQKPLIDRIKNKEYLTFIDNLINTDYNKYSESIGIALKVIKQKKEYKVTTTIQVAKDLLRKDLEKAGIIRKLGF